MGDGWGICICLCQASERVLEQVSFYIDFSASEIPSHAGDINMNPRHIEVRYVVSNSQEIVFSPPKDQVKTNTQDTDFCLLCQQSDVCLFLPSPLFHCGCRPSRVLVYQEPQISCKLKASSPQLSVKIQTIASPVVHLKGCLLCLFPAFPCVQQEVPDIFRKGSPTQYLVDRMSLSVYLSIFPKSIKL